MNTVQQEDCCLRLLISNCLSLCELGVDDLPMRTKSNLATDTMSIRVRGIIIFLEKINQLVKWTNAKNNTDWLLQNLSEISAKHSSASIAFATGSVKYNAGSVIVHLLI